MKTAIIHYWLTSMRGGEKVLEALCRLFPDADIYTHVYDPAAISDTIKQHRIHTTFINKLPFAKTRYQYYLPLMPLALEQLDLRAYDLVISSESGPAKGVLTRAGTPHICYCHTPMRYLWDMYQEYLDTCRPLSRLGMRLLSTRLRQWDVLTSLRVDHFAANSQTVANRIRKHYRREAVVIHPPVDVDTYAWPDGKPLPAPAHAPYLCLGQLVGYKRTDIAVKACTRANLPLTVIGDGPMRKSLEGDAGPTVRFLGWQSRQAVREHIRNAKALLFPGEEDFGMVPVEVQAAGRPVIAYAQGGALETVVDNVTGLFFAKQTEESLLEALHRFDAAYDTFDPCTISAHARRFAPERFNASFLELVAKALP